MRILIVSAYFEDHGGGVEIVAGRLARELAALGHQITWSACDCDPAPETAAVACMPLPSSNRVEMRSGTPVPLLRLSAFRRLSKLVEENDAILVHDTLYSTSLCAFAAARRHRKPLVIVQHIGEPAFDSALKRMIARAAVRLVSRPMLKRCDRAVMVSEEVRRHFLPVEGKRPLEIVFNGVDGHVFVPADPARRQSLRRHFGFAPASKVALYAGRFVSSKGLDTIRELARVRPDITFALAGRGAVDPREWNLPNVRVFEGLRGASLAELYQASDVFLLASPREGFSMVVREALSCGIPVICGSQTIRTDAALAGHALGIDIVEGQPAATASRFAARLDEAIADGRSEERRSFVAARYSWSGAARAYQAILTSALSARGIDALARRSLSAAG